MREFSKTISEAFAKGLRPDSRAKRNADFMEDAVNVIARSEGLQSYSPVLDPFNGNLTLNFPFPQIYRGESETLLLYEDAVHTVSESGSPWTSTLIASPPSGGIWHIADMKDSWYLFNGQCMVARLRDGVVVNTNVSPRTGTFYNGRVVIGGLQPTEVFGDEWDEVFDYWRKSNTVLPQIENNEPTRNYVMWSSIGGGDFPLWLFDEDLIRWGSGDRKLEDGFDYPVDKSYIIERLRLNQLGFMPMPFQGEVICIKGLGNGLMIYGEDGIVYMPHIRGDDRFEMPPTYGMEKILSIGVLGRGAVGGDESLHLFIDSNGVLRAIDSELQQRRIGYEEYLSSMFVGETLISMDPDRNEFYIADSEVGYLFSDGLTEIHQLPTGLFNFEGQVQGVFDDTEYDEALLVSNPFDFGMSGVKTLVGVNIGFDADVDATVDVAYDFKYTQSDNWTRSKFIPVNKEGNVTLRVKGLEFRLVIRSTDYTGFKVDYAHVKWQADDKRNIRGLGVMSQSGG